MICANNEIYHHGVKGQKWGIRRYQPYPKGKHGKFLGQDRDNDIKIDKGTEVYRVQQRTLRIERYATRKWLLNILSFRCREQQAYDKVHYN